MEKITATEFDKFAEVQLLELSTEIQELVGKGKRVDGSAQRRYSAGYDAAIKKGYVRGHNNVRKPKSHAGKPATLIISGDLMRSLQVKKRKAGEFWLFPSGSHGSGKKWEH